MELVVSEYNQCNLVEIFGRIDSYSTPEVETVLKAMMNDDHYNIIVDLQNVNYISSSGILTFVKIQRKFKQQNKGEIVFIQVPELVFKSFELAGFNTIFKYFDDLDSAKGWF